MDKHRVLSSNVKSYIRLSTKSEKEYEDAISSISEKVYRNMKDLYGWKIVNEQTIAIGKNGNKLYFTI